MGTEDEHIRLAMIENCQKCQGDGGPLGKLAKELEAVVAVLNERKGEKAVWKVVTAASMWAVGLLLAAFLQYKFTQFRVLQEDVARRLKETTELREHRAWMLERVPVEQQVQPK